MSSAPSPARTPGKSPGDSHPRAARREFAEFVRLAQLIDDGEAAAAAAAILRGYTLVLDDRKARRVLAPDVRMLWSLDLIHHWWQTEGISTSDLATVPRDIRLRARYEPHRSHPYISWWEQHIDRQ